MQEVTSGGLRTIIYSCILYFKENYLQVLKCFGKQKTELVVVIEIVQERQFLSKIVYGNGNTFVLFCLVLFSCVGGSSSELS